METADIKKFRYGSDNQIDATLDDEFTKIHANNDNRNLSTGLGFSRRPIHTRTKRGEKSPARHRRVSLRHGRSVSQDEGVKIGWSWERWNKWAEEKQRDESTAKSRRCRRRRKRESKRCVGSSWILIIEGGIFSAIQRDGFIYASNLRNEFNTRH